VRGRQHDAGVWQPREHLQRTGEVKLGYVGVEREHDGEIIGHWRDLRIDGIH
jgi:hypothetical protein